LEKDVTTALFSVLPLLHAIHQIPSVPGMSAASIIWYLGAPEGATATTILAAMAFAVPVSSAGYPVCPINVTLMVTAYQAACWTRSAWKASGTWSH
jgi:hypothetical protein